MRRTPGRKRSTKSPRYSERQPSTQLKVGLMLADLLEMSRIWKDMYPLEVLTGARTTHLVMRPSEDSAMIDVMNTEDGQEYQILVISKRPNGTGTPESSL